MPKARITCKLCGQEGPAADSHVIPRAFYELSKQGADHLVLVNTTPGEAWRKKSRIGLYDQALLCQACEARFQGLDAYGVEVFIRMPRTPLDESLPKGNRTSVIRGIDEARLRGFLIFLVWRILASNSPWFRDITHPKIEALLRQALLEGTLDQLWGPPTMFWLIGGTVKDGEPDLSNLMNGSAVVNEELFGVPVLEIGLGDIIAMVNLGNRPFDPPGERLQFPQCLERCGGLLLGHDIEISDNHIQSLREMFTKRKAEVEMRDRVLSRFRHSFGGGIRARRNKRKA